MISARLTQRDSLLFVYGTLRAFFDIPMARRLRREARWLGVARVAGRLYDLGRYPGISPPRRRGDSVTGELYRLGRPRRTLRALDRYEGRFVRELVRVRLGRREHRAWVYRFRGPVRARDRIASGDYESHLRRRRGDA
jgi:gamma-glutamylcyclotransferase (GGCT)/AIG2-like uncharacterized protein YtfP